MNLLQLRTKLATVSGRYDLVDGTTYADTGMDYYINAGQRYLDRQFYGKRVMGRYSRLLEVGEHIVNISLARVIKEVWLYNSTERFQLTKAALSWLRGEYYSTVGELENGEPLYYAPAITRGVPHFEAQGADEASFRANDADVLSGTSDMWDSVLIFPPTDEEYSIEVWGLFYSNELVEDTDWSYWSVTNPDVLVHATLRALEIDHRNTQGVEDWTKAIMANLSGLLADDLDEEITDINQMEG
jgi:hypothetical protein